MGGGLEPVKASTRQPIDVAAKLTLNLQYPEGDCCHKPRRGVDRETRTAMRFVSNTELLRQAFEKEIPKVTAEKD